MPGIRFAHLIGLFLLHSLLVGSTDIYGQNAIYYDDSQIQLVGNKMAYWPDRGGKLTLRDIQQLDIAGKMLPVGKDIFNHPASDDYFWFRLTVRNRSGKPLMLNVETAFVWYIDFYTPDSSGAYPSVIQTGTMRSEATRLVPVNTFWFPLANTDDTLDHTYYMRLNIAGPIEIPFILGTVETLYQHKQKSDFLAAGFMGIVLIMFLYNFFMMLFLREKQYLVYLGYLLTLVSVPYLNNYPFILNLSSNPIWWHEHSLSWITLGIIFIGLMAIVYMNLRRTLPIAWYILVAMILVLFTAGSVSFFIGKSAVVIAVFQPLVLILFITCIISSVYLMIKRQPQAYFYALGWTFMLVASAIYVFTVNGLLPYHFLTRNAAYFGAVIEIWLFSLALASRFNTIRREKEALQQANFQILKNQNQRLEEAVHERTHEIEARNESIRHQASQLEEANGTQLKLFSIISHDMRQPIASLKGLMQMVVSGALPLSKFQEIAPAVLQRVTTLSETLDNLLEWASTQMQGQSFHPESLDLKGIVDELVLLYEETAKLKSILIHSQIRESVYVLADGNHVRLILRNLMNNALKFTEMEGEITITARQNNNMLAVSVSDTGIGMAPEKAAGLFALERNESSLGTRGEKGVGLGLALCHEMVLVNGGSIRAESQPGIGTTITFTLMQAVVPQAPDR